ncbi:MAG TPA: hypothetical protein VHX61_14230 [Rhizomicrobium sp.]|jgi:hypothetical protein|nr:hypothetical protein [Rhizomicrobium sp.]
MSKKALMISAALVGLIATGPALAGKGSLYTLPPVSSSLETISFGVNDGLTVTGMYIDSSGNQHGFVGPADGSDYTSFDDSGGVTEPRGISAKGLITGYDTASLIPWERAVKGKITTITMDGNALNNPAQGINKSGTFTGNYDNTSGTSVGYLGKKAKYVSSFKLKGITNTGYAGRGIDDAGDIVGWYYDSSGIQHGFLLSGKKVTTIDDPGGPTTPEGINNKGEISGLYTDTSGNRHAFTYEVKTKKFSEIKISGSTFVEGWGLNDDGVVSVDGLDSTTGYYVGYLYCPSAKVCPSDAARAPQIPVLHRTTSRLPLIVP